MLSFQVRHVTVTVVLLVTALVWHSAGFAYQPEGPSGYTEKSAVKAKKFMIAAANPLAVRAGYEILKADGSAMDAAIAAELVLGLVEPQNSGLGGGGYLLHWDQSTQNVSTSLKPHTKNTASSLGSNCLNPPFGSQQTVLKFHRGFLRR
jgi:isoaspartyl peptidase/L-asparaginase-like protein (Ntn-hydrolase superfamily)